MRQEYEAKSLKKQDLHPSPFDQFRVWLEEAIAKGIQEPQAMALATASAQGLPSNRMVIMKHVDKRGFQFYTNFKSRKAQELEENSHATALFWWRELYQQVIIEGKVEKVSQEEAATLFLKRPRTSRISSWASEQDRPIENKEILQQNYKHYEKEFDGQEVLLIPPHCGNFLLVPSRFEFWQGQPHRLHDRFVYTLSGNKWSITRLSP